MRKQKRIGMSIVVGLLCLLPMIGAVALCSYEVEKNLEIEMQNTLRDVAEQNNVAVEKEIEERFSLLYSFAQELETDIVDMQTLLDSAKSFVDNYRFERIGYIYPIGIAYTTDGVMKDVSYEAFYENAMSGAAAVMDLPEESNGQQTGYVNQFSVPVYADGNREEITGVLFATYRTEMLEDILNTKAFEGKGYSCIVKVNGEVIAHSAGSPIYGEDNFFDCLSSEAGEDNIGNLEEIFQSGKSGTGSFVRGGKQDFYYTPLQLENGQLDWYMITMVPNAVLAKRVQPIKGIISQMFAIIMIVIGCAIAVFWMTHYLRRMELLKLAYTDPLTQGANYACFQKKMRKKRGVHGYLLAMDISGFKVINNSCGVAIGDEVLARVWKVLHKSLHDDELAARLYADRFILFLVEENREVIKNRLEKLVVDLEAIAEDLHTPHIFPVIGAYETVVHQQVETDYGNAIQAKHLIKGRRDRNFAFYEEVDHARVMEKRIIEDSFEQALEDRQFEIWYQPKYSAATGEMSGAEALVRWRKSDGTLMPPVKFIPVYEKNGMIPRLDEYVFRTVCMQQKQWEKEGKKILPVSINISRVSLYYLNIVDKYKAIVAENDIETQYLQLEITESATIGNGEVANLIEKFHLAGFKMLLDDFGSGYSSLSTLNMMHFDIMKLDKSLIDYIGDENGEKLLHYITKLGQNLGLDITAEGVETKEQVEFLKALQCDDIQGYYFSKPLQAEEFGNLLHT